MDIWPELTSFISNYPTIDGKQVGSFYHKKFSIPPDMVLPGNGSVELIYLVPRALRLKQVVVISPSFHEYIRAVVVAGGRTTLFPLSIEHSLAPPPLQQLEKSLSEAQALLLGTPNNPTGTLFHRDEILQLAERHPDKWLLVDEAFLQFHQNWQELTLMNPKYMRPKIVVFHSLTKFYALAGLRIGAVIAHPETISTLKYFKEPWTVNSIAELVVGVLSECHDYEIATHQIVSQERERLFNELEKIPGIRPFPTAANFLLIQWTASNDLDDLLRALLIKGLYVRDCRNFPGLEQNFFRVAVRMPAENDLLLEAISQFVEEIGLVHSSAGKS
jgi:threonine-phosphate decarboxylase